MNPAVFGVIALGVVLGIVMLFFLGYAIRAWLEARRQDEEKIAEQMVRDESFTNLDRATELIDQMYDMRAIQRELKSAFAGRELDGGAIAAMKHPLYIQAEEKLRELHDDLMILI